MSGSEMTTGNKLCIITILREHTGMSKLRSLPMKYFYSKIKPFIVNQQWPVYHVSCDLSVTQIMWAIQKGPTPTKKLGNCEIFS